jgi:GTP cyclohydrolase I
MVTILNHMFPEFRWDDSVERTAERFLAYLEEYSMAATFEPPFQATVFPTKVNQMIAAGPISFSSICKHHLLPYVGYAWTAYLPNKLMIGASKMPRIVQWCATKPTTQEELTAEIATYLKNKLEAQGVAVIMVAKHTCMSCRGVREREANLVTSEMRGAFLSNAAAKAEFMHFVRLP